MAAGDQVATPLANWWQRFNDPVLTDLVTQALQANTDVKAAQAALLQRAQRDLQAAGLVPTVGISASAQRSVAARTPAAASGRFRRQLGARCLRRSAQCRAGQRGRRPGRPDQPGRHPGVAVG
jgi:outer membrane protein TolC